MMWTVTGKVLGGMVLMEVITKHTEMEMEMERERTVEDWMRWDCMRD